MQRTLDRTQYVAEWVALERMIVRESHAMDSRAIGHLYKGEIVAVSAQWAAWHVHISSISFCFSVAGGVGGVGGVLSTPQPDVCLSGCLSHHLITITIALGN